HWGQGGGVSRSAPPHGFRGRRPDLPFLHAVPAIRPGQAGTDSGGYARPAAGANAHGAGRRRAGPAGRPRPQPGRAGEPAGALPALPQATAAGPDQVKPTSRTKCPTLRWSTPPPAQCTMDASKMMARMTTTTQKKNTTMPGMAYPATVLALATAASYPPPPNLFGGWLGKASHSRSRTPAGGFGGLSPAPIAPFGRLGRSPAGGRLAEHS